MTRLPRKFKKAWKKGTNITQKMCNKYSKYIKQIGITFKYDEPIFLNQKPPITIEKLKLADKIYKILQV